VHASECCRYDTTGKSLRLFRNCARCRALRAKIFLFTIIGKCALSGAVPRRLKRAYRDRHDTWRGVRWTHRHRRRAMSVRTVKPCGPVPSTLGSSSWTIPRATVANKPDTPGRARSSRNTIAQGTPVVSAALSLLACANVHSLCTQGSRVRPASGVPCALFIWRDKTSAKLGRKLCRENGKSCLFERTASQVRQSGSAWNLLRASWYMRADAPGGGLRCQKMSF
jgi:hypothetical protein